MSGAGRKELYEFDKSVTFDFVRLSAYMLLGRFPAKGITEKSCMNPVTNSIKLGRETRSVRITFTFREVESIVVFEMHFCGVRGESNPSICCQEHTSRQK